MKQKMNAIRQGFEAIKNKLAVKNLKEMGTIELEEAQNRILELREKNLSLKERARFDKRIPLDELTGMFNESEALWSEIVSLLEEVRGELNAKKEQVALLNGQIEVVDKDINVLQRKISLYTRLIEDDRNVVSRGDISPEVSIMCGEEIEDEQSKIQKFNELIDYRNKKVEELNKKIFNFCHGGPDLYEETYSSEPDYVDDIEPETTTSYDDINVEDEANTVQEENVLEEPILENPVEGAPIAMEEQVIAEPVVEAAPVQEPVMEMPVVENPAIVEPAVSMPEVVQQAPAMDFQTPTLDMPVMPEATPVVETMNVEQPVAVAEVPVVDMNAPVMPDLQMPALEVAPAPIMEAAPVVEAAPVIPGVPAAPMVETVPVQEPVAVPAIQNPMMNATPEVVMPDISFDASVNQMAAPAPDADLEKTFQNFNWDSYFDSQALQEPVQPTQTL